MLYRNPAAGSRLLRALRSAGAFVSDRIGWNRVGLAVSLVIIAVAAIVLYRTLYDLDVQELFKALRATEARDVVLAGLFVGFGYFTLTFYDLFALRTIGRTDVSYATAALAGFTSYSVGHNVGASVFTGGAVKIIFLDAIPRTELGKIKRIEIQKLLTEASEA